MCVQRLFARHGSSTDRPASEEVVDNRSLEAEAVSDVIRVKKCNGIDRYSVLTSHSDILFKKMPQLTAL